MNDQKKTKAQLIEELQQLRQQLDNEKRTYTQKLQTIEEREQLLFDGAAEGVIISNAKGEIVLANFMAQEMFGYKREELIGQSIEILIPQRFREDHIGLRSAYMQNPVHRPMAVDNLNLYARRKDGDTFPVEISLNVVETDRGIRILSFIFDITERRRSEEMLRANETRYHMLVENTPLINYIAMIDASMKQISDYGIIYVSPQLEKLLGYTPEEFLELSNPWAEIIHPDDLQPVWNAIRQHAQTNQALDIEFRATSKEKEIIWMHNQAIIVNDENGQPLYSQGILIDITRSKQAEIALSESEIQFGQILGNLPMGVQLRSGKGEVLYTNPASRAILGMTEKQLAADPDWSNSREIIHEDGSLFLPETLPVPQTITTGKPVWGTIMGLKNPKTKQQIWLQADAIPQITSSGKVAQVICTFTNITESKQTELERLRLAAIIEASSDLVMIMDANGQLEYINQAGRSMLGITPRQNITKKTITDFCSPEAKRLVLKQGIPESIQNGSWQSEITLINHEGNTIPVFQSILAQHGADGNVQFLAAIARDITERKNTEAALRNINETLANQTLELESRNLQLQAATEIVRETSLSHDLNKLLNQVVQLVYERFGFYHVGIFLVDEAREYAILRAASGEPGRQMLEAQHRLKIGETGIVGYVTDTGKPRIALDVGEDATHFKNPYLPRTRSEMALPLLVGGEIIGAIDVQSDEENAFTQDDVIILQVMADQVATSIENTRLFEQNQRALQELERRYSEQTYTSWQKRLHGSALAYNYDRLNFNPVSPGTADTQLVPDSAIDSSPHDLKASISLRGQSIGTIHMKRASDQPAWAPEDQIFMNEVATQIALALENARLVEETRDALSETQRLANRDRLISQVTDKIHQQTDIQSILEIATAELRRATGRKRAVIRLEMPKRGEDAS